MPFQKGKHATHLIPVGNEDGSSATRISPRGACAIPPRHRPKTEAVGITPASGGLFHTTGFGPKTEAGGVSDMDGVTEPLQGRLVEGLAQGGMDMDGAGDVLQ